MLAYTLFNSLKDWKSKCEGIDQPNNQIEKIEIEKEILKLFAPFEKIMMISKGTRRWKDVSTWIEEIKGDDYWNIWRWYCQEKGDRVDVKSNWNGAQHVKRNDRKEKIIVEEIELNEEVLENSGKLR